MYKIYYQPKGIWVGDIMPYGEDGTFYLYHQRDTRKPGPFGEPFGWSLATTKDFISYRDYGESLERGADDEVDQYVYAGTVFKAQGKYHALYTGCNRDMVREGKMDQVLLHAVSDDAVTWTKNIADSVLPPQPGYDARNWRDPYVIWDEQNEEYLLILGTRTGWDKSLMTGRLVKFTSKDLEHWTFGGDFWVPGLYTMFEMPDLFKMGEWWYLVFSEYSDGNKTRYRMAKSIDGPWITPADDSFDGRAYYAARTASDGERRVLFGWVPTRDEKGDPGSYLWGGTFVPLEIVQRADGTLGTKPPDSMLAAFSKSAGVDSFDLECQSGKAEHVISKDAGDTYMLDMTLAVEPGTAGFSIKLGEDTDAGLGYEFRINLNEGMLEFTAAPQYPWFQLNTMGLQRPLRLENGATVHVRMIVDDDIATIFVNDVALNARFCAKRGNGVSTTVTDGSISVANVNLSVI